MEYKADFGIDGGVSYGFGLKEPDYIEKTKILTADNHFNALKEAAKKARYFSKEHLSNPETELTKVTILRLYDPNGDLINQKEILKKEGHDITQKIKYFEWDNDCLFTVCSMLEHLFAYASK